MSNTVATPTLAQFIPGTPDKVFVDFSENLLPDAVVDPTNWFVRNSNLDRVIVSVLVGTSQVQITLDGDSVDVGADVVSYAASPADVITAASGLPVAAFTDFPIT